MRHISNMGRDGWVRFEEDNTVIFRHSDHDGEIVFFGASPLPWKVRFPDGSFLKGATQVRRFRGPDRAIDAVINAPRPR
jgi:hypothetical protein